MEAMNIAPELIDGSIRVSFCYNSTMEEVDAFVEGLAQALTQLT